MLFFVADQLSIFPYSSSGSQTSMLSYYSLICVYSYIINEGGVLNLYYVIIICEHIKIKSLENSWTKVSFLVFSKTNIDIWKMYRRPDPTYKPNTPPEESNSKGVIRIRKSKKNIYRQHNGQNEKVQIMVITKLPNSEQSYKGKVKTHKYINTYKPNTPPEESNSCMSTGRL
jgi:hypothetical protein